ncbi:MAG: hypothetical protein HRU70_06620 [Phycisphaeraceae bacterium]|nr:MAG: hypothetical protein HRU70_06620 [Phycisphaeraceae bacterium]
MTPNPDNPAQPPIGPGDLAQPLVSRLLEMAISTPDRPLDRVISKILAPNGHAWLTDALRCPAGLPIPSAPESAFADGSLPLDTLKAIKDRAKPLALSSHDPQTRLAATASYYVAIAAALVHHRTLITSQPAAELVAALADFAEAAPEPWSRLLGQAALNRDSHARPLPAPTPRPQ